MLRDLDDRLEEAGATSLELKQLLRVDGAYRGVLWDERDNFVRLFEDGVGPRAAVHLLELKRSA